MRATLLLGLFAAMAGEVSARPFSVDDLLMLESYGQASIDPGERWLVVERIAGRRHGSRFAYDFFSRRQRTSLFVADLGALQLIPLLPHEPGAGYQFGGWSPSGRRAAVFRLAADRLQLGVVEMASRQVRWLAAAPDQPPASPAPLWLDDAALLVVSNIGGALPNRLDYGWRVPRRLGPLWRATARGDAPAASAIGSGAFVAPVVADKALVRLDVASGGAVTLAVGAIVDVALSADRRHAAIIERVRRRQPRPGVRVELGDSGFTHHLRLVDLARGTLSTPCADCEVLTDVLAWAPAAPQLLVFARRAGSPRIELIVVDAPKAAARRLNSQALDLAGGGAATWQGRRPLAAASRGAERGWHAFDAVRPPRRLALPASGEPVAVTKTHAYFLADGALWAAGRSVVQLTAAGRAQRALTALDPYSAGTRRPIDRVGDGTALALRIDGKRLAWLGDALDSGDHRGGALLAASRRRAATVALERSASGAAALVLADRRGRRVLDRINSHLVAVSAAAAVYLPRRAAAGVQHDWLLLPPGADAARRLPLVVIPYPGLSFGASAPAVAAPDADITTANVQLLAANGYAVLLPSLPLAAGEPAAAIVEAASPAIAAAVATGRIDADRIALFGHSYGGYAALTLAAHGRYRSVIAAAAVSDLYSFYAGLEVATQALGEVDALTAFGWAESGQGGMGAPPWTIGERYLANSPFHAAPRITAPVLLLHGDLDSVPVAQAERMFGALYRLGRDACLLRFHGEGHVLESPANIREAWRRILGWLAVTMPAAQPDQQPSQASRLAYQATRSKLRDSASVSASSAARTASASSSPCAASSPSQSIGRSTPSPAATPRL